MDSEEDYILNSIRSDDPEKSVMKISSGETANLILKPYETKLFNVSPE